MKFCLNAKQKLAYIQYADELKVSYFDKDGLFDLIVQHGKTIVLDCTMASDINWKEIERYNQLANGNFILCLNNFSQLRTASSLRLRSYLGYPINSFYELNSIAAFKPEYILLGPELFFDMPAVKKCTDSKIRVIPNVAYSDDLPRINGICGTWIRPEDLESVYGEYVDAVEFEGVTLDGEQALYRIYAQNKEWRQELQLIVLNLDVVGTNRLLSSEVSKARLTCQHKCQRGKSCRICERAFSLAQPERIREYIDSEKLQDN